MRFDENFLINNFIHIVEIKKRNSLMLIKTLTQNLLFLLLLLLSSFRSNDTMPFAFYR